MVVNSACRSGFFASVGRSVFSSQDFSLSEGLRFAEGGWTGATVCVETLESALMTRRSLRPLLLCYAKDSGRASAPSPSMRRKLRVGAAKARLFLGAAVG